MPVRENVSAQKKGFIVGLGQWSKFRTEKSRGQYDREWHEPNANGLNFATSFIIEKKAGNFQAVFPGDTVG